MFQPTINNWKLLSNSAKHCISMVSFKAVKSRDLLIQWHTNTGYHIVVCKKKYNVKCVRNSLLYHGSNKR